MIYEDHVFSVSTSIVDYIKKSNTGELNDSD